MSTEAIHAKEVGLAYTALVPLYRGRVPSAYCQSAMTKVESESWSDGSDSNRRLPGPFLGDSYDRFEGSVPKEKQGDVEAVPV